MSEKKEYVIPTVTRVKLEDKRVVVMVTCRKEDTLDDPNCWDGETPARDNFDPS